MRVWCYTKIKPDISLHSQYLPYWHIIEVVKRIYIPITPGNQRVKIYDVGNNESDGI